MTAVAEKPLELTSDTDPRMRVIEGVQLSDGQANTPDGLLLENIKHSTRLGHSQVWPQRQPHPGRVVIVGGGPSLEPTFDELRGLIFEGAHLVTLNGAHRWCVERNLQPNCQVVVDARASNARFVDPDVPRCRYYLASQCHPETWARVAGREFVGIFHAVGPEGEDTEAKAYLDQFYLGNWHGVAGGTTVMSRAIGLLRSLGYLRFDLFGIDSCFMNGQHHAYDQAENVKDRLIPVKAAPEAHDEKEREFLCAPWHLKQVEDMLRFIRFNGDKFLLNVHGDGLLAHVLRTNAEVVIEEAANGSASVVSLQSSQAEDR